MKNNNPPEDIQDVQSYYKWEEKNNLAHLSRSDIYRIAELSLTDNMIFVDHYGVRRFLDKYIEDICQDIRETADANWSVDDVWLAIKRVVAKKLDIEY